MKKGSVRLLLVGAVIFIIIHFMCIKPFWEKNIMRYHQFNAADIKGILVVAKQGYKGTIVFRVDNKPEEYFFTPFHAEGEKKWAFFKVVAKGDSILKAPDVPMLILKKKGGQIIKFDFVKLD